MRLVFLLLLLMPFLMIAQDHLLITEIQTVPTDSSFIEIYNPTPNTIVLDNVYLADNNTYYQVVENLFTSNSQDFLVKFPNSTSIASKTALVIALNGAGYETKYGSAPDYEILGTSANAPDMMGLFIGTSAQFNTHEMMILFQWDGNSDLIQDIDYSAWGLFPTTFVDKSGLSIDGPDAGPDSSLYLSDTPVSSQSALAALTSETQSIQRIGITEGTEILSGGNGLTGHDETSEDLINQFALANPTPGVVQEVPGDGSGTVTVSPDSIEISSTSTFNFTFTGESSFILDKVQITVPSNWVWSGQAGDVSISGTGFSGSSISVNGTDILIENTAVTTTETGTITIQNLTAPAQKENSVFTAKTAVSGGNLSNIQNSPRVVVWTVITIADIQNDPGLIGSVVTLDAIVTVGAGISATDWTDAYIQDNSGRGINVYRDGTPIDPELVRGNKIRITGSIGDHNGVTQIEGYSLQVLATNQPLPSPLQLTASVANDLIYEGTYIEVKGYVTNKFSGGGGTTLRINDGSGEVAIRVWDSANLNIDSYVLGDTIAVKGVMDIYSGASQILLSYQDDIDFSILEILGDGSGIVTASPGSVAKDSLISMIFNFKANSPDTLTKMSIDIPNEWIWTGNTSDVSLNGAFVSGIIQTSINSIEITGFSISEEDSGSIAINNISSPNIDTASVFVIKTATEIGFYRNIKDLPIIMTGKGTNRNITLISDIQTKFSLYDGKIVNITGWVTIGSGILRTTFTDAYVQDSSGMGINVYRSSTIDKDLKRGNYVLIRGLIEDFNGKTEIKDYTLSILRNNFSLPEPEKVTTKTALDLNFEGTFVEVSGAISENYTAGDGINIVVDDGIDFITLRIWDTAKLDVSEFLAGRGINAKGIISEFSGEGQLLIGYQQDLDWFILPVLPSSLWVHNKPFVPEKGEKFYIKYKAGSEDTHNTMRIYDLSGRLVTTLLDQQGSLLERIHIWDGTDQLNDLVPLGTYILHYEVVNNSSGKRWQKAAPIVVGTVLK